MHRNRFFRNVQVAAGSLLRIPPSRILRHHRKQFGASVEIGLRNLSDGWASVILVTAAVHMTLAAFVWTCSGARG